MAINGMCMCVLPFVSCHRLESNYIAKISVIQYSLLRDSASQKAFQEFNVIENSLNSSAKEENRGCDGVYT